MELSLNWLKAIPRFIEDYDRFKNPPNYYITFPEISGNASFIGGGYLFIGEVVKNWIDGNFTQSCPACKETVYVLRVGCSLTSGRGLWTGICLKCGKVESRTNIPGVLMQGSLCGKWSGELGYRPIIQESSPYHYTIQDGLTRLGDKEEIRMDVPLWLEFMKENYPDCLE
jgi:hypothetical protein